jgi:hypothetical protein
MKRKSEREQKKLADDARLLQAWRKFHREERDAVVAGPHGVVLGELFRMFKNLEHVQPSQLIGLTRTIDWAAIDYATRLVVLHEANNSIIALREKRGLDPIDDPLDEATNVFRTLRNIITSFPSSAGKPRPATANPGEQ